LTGSPVQRVAVQGDGLLVQNARGEGGQFDYVILAVQANQLGFLEGEQFQREKQVLDKVRFDSGELWLHRDRRFLPRRTADWSALNFQTDPDLERVMFTVLVNAVEPTLTTAEPVLQTWNPLYEPEPATVMARVPLQRAVVHAGTAGVHQALAEWHSQPGRRVFYTGSWAYPGVPLLESAVCSAQAVVSRLQVL
jgi:predicted NAD/FAD-binding protein